MQLTRGLKVGMGSFPENQMKDIEAHCDSNDAVIGVESSGANFSGFGKQWWSGC